MLELLQDTNFVWIMLSLVILGLSQLLKLPIKALNKKLIKNQNVRNRVNATIMLIPLALGILADYLFCTLYLQVPFSITEGLKIGGTAITLYGVFEKLFKGEKSKETKAVENFVGEVLSDGKVDKNDTSAVKEFYEKVK